MNKRILEVAKNLFLSHGPKNATMDDIASNSGVSKKTLYEAFSSKEILVESVHAILYTEVNLLIDAVRKQELDPISELFLIEDGIFEYLKYNDDIYLNQLMVYYPEIYNRVKDDLFNTMRACLNVNIDRGIDQGIYLKDIEKEVIANFYIAVNLSIKQKNLFIDLKKSQKQLKNDYLLFHLRSIVSEKGGRLLNQILKNR